MPAQEVSLLTTKLYIPLPRPNLVPRPRLIPHLDGGLRRGHRLTLRSFMAVFVQRDYPLAIEMAAGALQVLGPDQAHWRVMALWSMAESQECSTDLTQAIATLREDAGMKLALVNSWRPCSTSNGVQSAGGADQARPLLKPDP